MKGRVIWWNPKSGYGFIEYIGGSIFVHQVDTDSKKLEDGIEIEFESITTEKGLFIRCLS